MRNSYSRYNAILMLIPACCFFILGAINLVADPYDIFPTPTVSGLNDVKHGIGHISEPYKLLMAPYDTVIIGSSRTQGIYCEDIADIAQGQHLVCKNASMPHSYASWLLKSIRHANFNHNIKRIFFGLDFFGFNMSTYPFNQSDEERLLGVPGKSNVTLINDILRQLFSSMTTRFSVKTLVQSIERHHPNIFQLHSSENALASDVKEQAGHSGQTYEKHQFFQLYPGILRYYVNYSYTAPGSNKNVMREFSDVLRYCSENNIQVYFFINPFHSALLDIFQRHHCLDRFLTWKADLARLVNEADAGLDKPLFFLWDFTGYNDVTTERIMSGQEVRPALKYYEDLFHFTRVTGRLVLKTMLTGQVEGDFGTLLAPGPPQDLGAALERGRQTYLGKNDDYLARLFSRDPTASSIN